ncbi:type II toxin-antitoxin system RelE/ParE family toxin [Candidatus Woesearchaeota archaeon]|nr:type II toxin-antitoxin system RelE/ParE family toxin [Candidatus Woesearchaeota archaeon]
MYEAVFSDEFKTQLGKIKKKDRVLYERLEKKIRDILLEPTHLKHLRNVLKGQQRVHLGSFVLKFSHEDDIVYFITIEHHDKAY